MQKIAIICLLLGVVAFLLKEYSFGDPVVTINKEPIITNCDKDYVAVYNEWLSTHDLNNTPEVCSIYCYTEWLIDSISYDYTYIIYTDHVGGVINLFRDIGPLINESGDSIKVSKKIKMLQMCSEK